MKRPYPPAWSIIPQAFVRKERRLRDYKVAGTSIPLVSPGQDVVPNQPILRWQDSDKNFTASSSLVTAAGLPRHRAPTSQQILPAGLSGRVVEITSQGGVVIESHATLVQGVIGAGDQVVGVLTLWYADSFDSHQTIPPGAILVVPSSLNLLLLRQTIASGIVGIVASSIALRDLEGFLHVDLIEYLQEERTEQRMLLQQQFPRLTLLFTEGLGNATMSADLVSTLKQYEGSLALLSGETFFRHSIVPELLISPPPNSSQWASPTVQPNTSLIPGARVRVYGGEQQGTRGTIDYLFAYEQQFPSGLRARAARLRLEDSSFLVVPLFSLERIG